MCTYIYIYIVYVTDTPIICIYRERARKKKWLKNCYFNGILIQIKESINRKRNRINLDYIQHRFLFI